MFDTNCNDEWGNAIVICELCGYTVCQCDRIYEQGMEELEVDRVDLFDTRPSLIY